MNYRRRVVSSNHNKEKYIARTKKHGFVSAKRNQEILVIVFLGGYTRWIIQLNVFPFSKIENHVSLKTDTSNCGFQNYRWKFEQFDSIK